jgi:excisionase family DNA binding protein
MPKSGHFQCPICCQNVKMLTVSKAANDLGVTSRTIYLWVKQGRVHFRRTVTGQIRICQNSLFFSITLTEHSESHLPDIDYRANKAMKLIQNQYYHSDLSLGIIAKQVGISVCYLSRLFKKNYQIGFRTALRRIRMQKAEDLLKDPKLSIKEVAVAVGYNYASDFDYHFKLHCGLTPKAYRQIQKE